MSAYKKRYKTTANAANSDKQQHASPRVTLRLTNTGNNQFKSSSARQDEKNKKIAEEQNASMTNDTKTVETEEKPETPNQSVSQSSASVSTSAPAESTSASTSKETESKDGGSGEATDTVNSSSNESTVKPSKETDNLKRPIVEEDEEVKPKKRKEDHSQSSKGKNEASSPKPDSDEDKSGGSGPSNADSPGGGPKVPPLKIVIPTTDADTGTRTNGKNGNRSHHTALPYVVPSEESPPASNQPNSPKSPQKATSDTVAVEEQKSPQTRVLRSSNRCGSNSSGAPSRGTSPIVPDEQLAQTTSPAAVTVDAGSGNPSPSTTRSEQTENVSAVISGDDKQATTTAAATATTTSESTVTAELSGMELHPRRRKLKASRTESETSDTSSAANVTAVETNPSGTTSEPAPVTNCYQMFLNIRKQIDKRRKNLFPVQPKPPSGFKDYLMNRCTYVLAGNSNSRVVNTQTPSPANLHEQLKKLFVEQEKERQRLRVQHIVETDPNSRLELRSTTKGVIWFDQVSLMPMDTYKGHGFRKDLFGMLKDLKPAFIRFPGGCFVEGDYLRNAFRWKETIGQWEERPGHFGDVWNYWTDDGLGHFEFLQLAEDLGARPVWVFNNGVSHHDEVDTSAILPFVQEILDGLEFARGDPTSTWGSVRAKMGHPEPFDLKYVAIGNEDCGKSKYRGNYLKFYSSIKDAYPDIRIISNCDGSSSPLDHPADLYDFHIYSSASSVFSNARHFDSTRRSGPKAFISEYAVTGNDAGKGSLLAALAEAGFLIGVEKNSEAIEMASYAPLFVNDNDRRWNPDAIVFTSSQMYGTPSYWMQHFFKESNGATLLSSSLQANPSNSLIASAITWRNSVDNNEYLRIKVVNFGTITVTLKISISGLDQNSLESSGAIKTTLTSTNVMDENSFKEPNKVSPVKAMLEKVSESMDVVLSPRSLTSFDLLRKSISSSVDTDSVLKSSY